MSSVGQALGGIVGAVVGFYVGGGPQGALYGAQIGMGIGSVVDPPKGPKLTGPRLDDLSVQTSTYGAFIPRVYGTVAQNGNVFWLKGDKLTEVQSTTTSGGKGGPQTTTKTFNYYATFAVGLCKGPIAGVRRIWIGSDLYYDAGSSDLSAIIASNQNASTFTLYTGTDTQNPDPLIQADRGAANVPAYRGLAYIVFDNLPLEKYQNSLVAAQVKVEIVSSGVLSDSVLTLGNAPTSLGPWAAAASGIFVYVASNNASTLQIYNVADPYNPQLMGSATTLGNPLDIAIDGRYAYIVSGVGTTLEIFDIGDPSHPTSAGSVNVSGNGHSYIAVSGSRAWITDQTNSLLLAFDVLDKSAPSLIGSVSTGLSPRGIRYANGYVYLVNYTGNTLQVFSVVDDVPVLAGSVSTTGNPVSIAVQNSIAYVTAYIGNTLQLFDVSDPLSPSALGSVATPPQPISVAIDGDYAYAVNYNNNSLYVFDVTNPLSPSVAGYEYTGATPAYVVVSDSIVSVVNRTIDSLELYFFHGGQITSSAIDLSAIVEAECVASNLITAADLDVTDLTDTVRGYRVSQLGAIRAGLDPLRAAWPFDVRQHGYQIQFVRRGGASVVTIPASDLDARAAGTAPGVSISDVREMDLVLPRTVSVKYLDAIREYDINEQIESRANTDAVGHTAVDLPIVMTAAEAKQATAALLYLYWMERYDISFVLPSSYQDLEPGDPIEITATNATYNLRLTSVTWLPDGRVECRAKYNSAALYTQVSVADEGQSTGVTLGLAGPSAYELLDIPLLRDDDDTAGFPVAISGYLTGWPGGVLYRSDDSGQTWSDIVGVTAPGAVIGYATGTLASHGGTVIDFASTLAVKLYSGSLASVTQAQMFAGQNWFAYGANGRWEIIAAQNCVLQGDGSYVLSDFLRGQKGTEWATGLHAAYDRMVLLDAAVLAFISVNASTIGATRGYRAITTGKAIDSDATQDFSYAGVNLECLSPVQLTGNRHPTTHDWTLTWTRRGRLDSWRDYVDLPLGETTEAYEVDIFTDGTYATVKRTLSSLTSATATYTSAQQVTDFGSNQATLYLKIYQLSATVGRGYALTQSITR